MVDAWWLRLLWGFAASRVPQSRVPRRPCCNAWSVTARATLVIMAAPTRHAQFARGRSVEGIACTAWWTQADKSLVTLDLIGAASGRRQLTHPQAMHQRRWCSRPVHPQLRSTRPPRHPPRQKPQLHMFCRPRRLRWTHNPRRVPPLCIVLSVSA